jgi:hypothetical protein
MTTSKKAIKKTSNFSALTFEQGKALSISIRNSKGVHTHERNGEFFQGKQSQCPLCENGSQFEKTMGGIGA